MPETRFLIVGGGPAGSATALTLARAGCRVTLIEQTNYQGERVGELLSPEGQAIMASLCPNLFEQFYLTQIGIVGTWGSESLSPLAEREWWTLERRAFDRALAEEARQAGAELFTEQKVRSVSRRHDRGWSVLCQDRHLEADWLIDASGRSSQISRLQGAQIQKFDRQIALVGLLEGDVVAPPDMVLETTDLGWWYAAPVDSQRAVAVFITDSDLDKGDAGVAWESQLQASQHVKDRFGNLKTTIKPWRVAAGFSLLVPGYGKDWCAVGDAYAAFDPLSDLGIGRSVDMGFKLGSFLAEAAQHRLEPDLFSLYEHLGSEFRAHADLLLQDYRQVQRFPHSKFWQRRVSSSPHESPLRVRSQGSRPGRLIFPEGQRFECTGCGKCCRSKWVARVDITKRDLFLEKRGFQSLRILSDGRLATNVRPDGSCVFQSESNDSCELFGEELRPDSCLQFPFMLRETPDGVEVGVSFICPSIQKNQGRPLQEYSQELEGLLARRSPNVIPRMVSVSWGRGLNWTQYKELETFLLDSGPLIDRMRRLRWYLIVWLHNPEEETPGLLGDAPLENLQNLEAIMATHLMSRIESDDPDIRQTIVEKLLERGRVRLPRLGWSGGVSQLKLCLWSGAKDWLQGEVERYLRSLVQRKFLLLNIPLLHNLCVLSALTDVVQVYTAAHACKRGATRFTEEDYFAALELVESEVVAYSRPDRLAQSFAAWHQSLYSSVSIPAP